MSSAKNIEQFADLLFPEDAVEPVLEQRVGTALMQWLEEIWAADELADVGVAPRRRALFYGPPGTGKTTLAHHLAARLGLSLAVVQSERLISKYLGGTPNRVANLFEAAAAAEDGLVLFLDEVDSLAVKRAEGAENAQQEMNRATNTFLTRLERYPGLVIGATNREAEIDPAIWRRFEVHVELGIPGQASREKILARYLAPYAVSGEELTRLARDFAGASPALIRSFCEALKRLLVIGPRCGLSMECEDVIGRVIASIEPHPSFDARPSLWVKGARAPSVQGLSWPMMRSDRNLPDFPRVGGAGG